MERSAALQLDIIREVTGIFEQSKMPYWMYGGWAVDFAAGKVTREHADIDFVIWRSDRSAALKILAAAGFVPGEAGRRVHQMALSRAGFDLEIDFIEQAADGSIICPGEFGDWPWTPQSFGFDTGAIGELRVRIVSPRGQLEAKEGFPRHRSGAPLREKDVHDIGILREIVQC